MGRILMCIGDRAEKPYFFEKSCQNVYSMEELCYVIGENIYLLDDEIVEKPLVKWVEEECHLKELAKPLYALVNQKASASAFVGTILDFVGYFSKEKTTQFEKILKEGRNLNLYERKKERADFLAKRGKLGIAITEYEKLIGELGDRDPSLLAKIYHNKGVVQTGLYAYAYAAADFLSAYEITGSKEEYETYLAAMRLSMEEQEYIRFIAENSNFYESSLVLEKRINQIMEKWQESEERKHMDVLLDYKENGNKSLYYREVKRAVDRLKTEYRECVTT